MIKKLTKLILLLCISVSATAGIDVPVMRALNGSAGQLKKDSTVMVEDAKFFDLVERSFLITPYPVRNMVSLEIDEDAMRVLQSNFSVTVKVQITTTDLNEATQTFEKYLTVNYNEAGKYQSRDAWFGENAYRVDVKILNIDSGAVNWPVSSVLKLVNQLQSYPKYKFSCSENAVTIINYNNSVPANTINDHFSVSWTPERAADEYDLEWTFIDTDALSDSLYGDPNAPNAEMIFANNASRVTISGSTYDIPLFYDSKGTLFFRVRSVQWTNATGPQEGRMEANWSSTFGSAGLGKFIFDGHSRALNWQSTISFAEEGKRKAVVQYYDGSLRSRQTVTKDNVTNNTIVGESLYDYQGRPVIQVLPVPSYKSVIGYTPNFTQAIGGVEYDKSLYDTLTDPSAFCNQTGLAMAATSGAARYYSPGNDSLNANASQLYKMIPDAEGFPFSEVVYMQDNTGRVSRQSGVGSTFKIGSGHETRYYYGTPDQREMDALFGTEVGDRTHYFKNMVRDANGQFSVSYVDMRGRTIATALAGDLPAVQLDTLASKNNKWITQNLLSTEDAIRSDLVMESRTALVVAKEGGHYFRYQLDPQILKMEGCDTTKFCYDCLYDLRITITDDCNNQNLGGQPYDTVVKNFSLSNIDTACNAGTGFTVNIYKYLVPGVYQVSKVLTLSKAGMEFYRDSVYLKRNHCKSLEEFVKEQRQAIIARMGDCIPTCSACVDSVGTWSTFWKRYRMETGVADADTASIKSVAENAWVVAVNECKLLCGDNDELYSTKQSMLSDVTPSSGQYANINKIDNYSILFPGVKMGYAGLTGYRDGSGQLDSVFLANRSEKVPPESLTAEEFVNNFKESWAETLLQKHPEYCKYTKQELLKESYQWDKKLEEVNTYAIAKARGFLNPTGNQTGVFSYFKATGIAENDPLTTLVSGYFRTGLENALLNYPVAPGVTISLWGVAGSIGACGNTTNSDCVNKFRSGPALDTASGICDADRNMAWVNFRQMYLGIKKKLINEWLKSQCPDVPSVATLSASGYQSRFGSAEEILSANGMSLPNNLQELEQQKALQEQKMKDFYNSNCEAYARLWLSQLSNCTLYDTTEIKEVIIPRLVQVCKEGADESHPMGSSSVKPSSTYQFKSFEEVIDNYNLTKGIKNNGCNSYLITAPKPYDKPVVPSWKPLSSKPDSCECSVITMYHNEYNQLSAQYSSFTDFMRKVYATNISDSLANMLLGLCDGSYTCNFLEQQIALPPAFQCNTGSICIDCDKYREVEKSFRQKFPGVMPVSDMTVTDSAQKSWNKLYENYFNTKLGFTKTVADYLAFARQCDGKWRSPGCDSLNKIVEDFTVANPAPVDCQESFRTFFNNAKGTSFTRNQIDSIYYRTCGRGLQICGIVDSLNKWATEYDAARANLLSITTAYSASASQTITNLADMTSDGVLQLPAPGSNEPDNNYRPLQLTMTNGTFCWQSGYTIEARMKFRQMPAVGDFLASDIGNLKVWFTRTANGIYLKKVEDDQGLVRNFPTGAADSIAMKDSTVLTEWFRLKLIVSPSSYVVYFNSRKIWDTVRNTSLPLTSYSSFTISPVGRKAAFDWIKIFDQNNVQKYFENYLTPEKPAIADRTLQCPTPPGDCKEGFRAYYNTKRGTSFTFNQIDSVYLLFTGRSLDVCGIRAQLETIRTNFNANINPYRLHFFTQSNEYPEGSAYRTTSNKDLIIDDGYMRFQDTMRLSDTRGWVYHQIGLVGARFCAANGYSVEWSMKMLRQIGNGMGDQYYYQDGNISFTLYSRNINPNPGFLVTGIRSKDDTGGLKVITPGNLKVLDPDPYSFYKRWHHFKLVVKPDRVIFYHDSVEVWNALRATTFPLQSFSAITHAFYNYHGAIDYEKMYDYKNELQFTENFDQPYLGTTVPASFLCPKPTINCQTAFINYFRQQTGLNLTFAKIDSIYYASTGKRLDACGTAPLPPPANYTLCGREKEAFPEALMEEINKCTDSTYFITSKSQALYNVYIDSLKGAFEKTYRGKCLDAYKFEKFTVLRPVSEYHYTLYYYDQGGNLVKTVPPSGVHPNYDSVWLDNVAAARVAGTKLVPEHELVTNYRFNTLSQVVAQHSPDGGLSKFWYDRLGRLVISQNAKQRYAAATEENRLYSYTKYDNLGRIKEVGQVKNLSSNLAMHDTVSRKQSNLDGWLTALNQRREQITSTIYDLPYAGFVGVTDNSQLVVQRNLRNRVSYTTYTDGWNTASYNQGTFYTYDIHGNVDTLLQDFGCGNCGVAEVQNLMNQNGNRFKKIAYNYDLISGKVNSVAYQKGWSDQFFHRYLYDGENRLTQVETSLDGFVWERDARYEYYLHGPLARTVLGQQQVQGVDFAYTLQGWLKGVNSAGATDSFDIGGDGKLTSSNRYVARDAFGFALNYYGNEFKPIDAGSEPFPGYSAYLNTDFRPLYNGNISSMVSTNRVFERVGSSDTSTMLFNYKYDQLNRITGMDVFHQFNRTINAYTGITKMDAFRERVSYDGNGNILTYKRNSNGAVLEMDDLTYSYYPGTNRLRRVRDNVPAARYGANANDKIIDIDDQADDDNYVYDSIGNLIHDKAEKINNINWNVYGKITGISRGAGVHVPASEIAYTYDASGNRISKVIEKGGNKYITWYVRDASGNVMATYNSESAAATSLSGFELNQNERYIYGSSRLGVVTNILSVDNGDVGPKKIIDTGGVFWRGEKMYELSNHLGNVLVTISDKKKGVADPLNAALIKFFEPYMLSGTDYYPFGMAMRIGGDSSYRYGFNGKENDNEVKGGDNLQINYGFRVYDSRIGRFLSVDPLTQSYPYYSPYQFAGNIPIAKLDLDGLEEYDYTFYLKSRNGGMCQIVPPTATQVIKNANAPLSYNFKFNLDGKLYHANSMATLNGRDDNIDGAGSFTGVQELNRQDLVNILGYSSWVINRLYSGNVEDAILTESNAGPYKNKNSLLDFKNRIYNLFEFNQQDLITIDGITYNANEAGNYLWAFAISHNGSLLDPEETAERGTRGRSDEPHEKKAIRAGTLKGNSFRLTKEEVMYVEDIFTRMMQEYESFYSDPENKNKVFRPVPILSWLKEAREKEGKQPTLPKDQEVNINN